MRISPKQSPKKSRSIFVPSVIIVTLGDEEVYSYKILQARLWLSKLGGDISKW